MGDTGLPVADPGALQLDVLGTEVVEETAPLAYAFGWATDVDPPVGRMTIGIGAGNPGGGTFHAVVVAHDQSHAFRLVDEPFEPVPEGGPDLTAEQARTHVDLEFIWWVADHVMERDRRAWWMLHWLLGTRAYSTAQVFEREEPVLLVANDVESDVWQLIGSSDAGPDGKIGHLYHAVDEDPTLIDALDLQPGHSAIREHVGGTWMRRIDEPEQGTERLLERPRMRGLSVARRQCQRRVTGPAAS